MRAYLQTRKMIIAKRLGKNNEKSAKKKVGNDAQVKFNYPSTPALL